MTLPETDPDLIVPQDDDGYEDDGDEDSGEGAAPPPEEKALEPERKPELVPVSVVAELRADLRAARSETAPMRKQLEETQAKLDQLTKMLAKQSEGPAPDPATDPVDYIITKLQELDRDKAETARERQERQAAEAQAKQVEEFNTALANEYRRFAAETAPDLQEAANHLLSGTIAELKKLGWNEYAVNNFVNYIERLNAQEAIEAGKSPAQLIWERAVASGYVPKAKQEQQADATKKRALASQARGIGGSGASAGGMTKKQAIEEYDAGGRRRAAVMKYFEDGSVHKLPSGA